mgnify:FL=1
MSASQKRKLQLAAHVSVVASAVKRSKNGEDDSLNDDSLNDEDDEDDDILAPQAEVEVDIRSESIDEENAAAVLGRDTSDGSGTTEHKQMDQDWEKSYSLLRQFVCEKGHLPPPALNSPTYPRLGKWCVEQRKAYEYEQLLQEFGADGLPQDVIPVRHRISRVQIKSLEAIGFEWAKSAWDIKYEMLKKYYKEHGTARVLRNTVVDGVALGKWVGTQRSAYRCEMMRREGKPLQKNPPRINSIQIAKLNVR